MMIDLTCVVIFQCTHSVFMFKELPLFPLVRSCKIVLCTAHHYSCTSCAHAGSRMVLLMCSCNFTVFSLLFIMLLQASPVIETRSQNSQRRVKSSVPSEPMSSPALYRLTTGDTEKAATPKISAAGKTSAAHSAAVTPTRHASKQDSKACMTFKKT